MLASERSGWTGHAKRSVEEIGGGSAAADHGNELLPDSAPRRRGNRQPGGPRSAGKWRVIAHGACRVLFLAAVIPLLTPSSYALACAPGDFDLDEDVDLRDVAEFQRCFTADGLPYDLDGVATHDVSVGPNIEFVPADITIEAGDTVRWTWAGGLHNVVSGTGGVADGHFSSGEPTFEIGVTFEVLFDLAFLFDHPASGDVYPYFDEVLWEYGMTGTVAVDRQSCSGLDFDIDGDVDLVDWVTVVPWLTGPIGRCIADFGYVSYDVPAHPGGVAAADMDLDGDLDVVVGSFGYAPDGELFVFFNQDGALGDGVIYSSGDQSYDVLAADLNGDGAPDVASAADYVTVWLNDGTGGLTSPASYGPVLSPDRIAAADLDGDGHNDLVAIQPYSDQLVVYWNDGGGAFPTTALYVLEDSDVYEARALFAYDLTGDGAPEVIFDVSTSSTVQYMLNRGDGTLDPPASLRPGATGSSFAPIDYDRDGDVDTTPAPNI